MATVGRSSGRGQDIAFGKITDDLGRMAFQFGAMAGAAQQLYASLNVFRELDKQLTLTNAIAQGTAKDLEQMSVAVRQFALGTTFTASQSANALLFLAQAGFNTQQAITAMTGVLALAQGSLEDVNETADLVASTITSFGLAAEDSTRIANLFAASMSQSLATLPKLAYALRQVGPVAASFGVSIEDTTGALSELFDVGLRGEQAGTALRNVMINLISPVGAARDIIKTLDLQVYKADGTLRDFYDILRDLSRFNLSDTDLTTLFGREALSGGIALLNSARTGALTSARDNISGTNEAFRIALEQMTSFDAQVKQMQNAIDEFRISLGEEFADFLTPILGTITDLALGWRDLDGETKAFIVTLASLSAATLVGTTTFSALLKIAGAGIGVIGKLGTSFAESALQAGNFFRGVGTTGPIAINTFSGRVSSLFAAFAAGGPAIGIATAALLGVGGFIFAITEAGRAAQEAKLDERIGEFTDLGPQIQRNFANIRQMTAAADPFSSSGAMSGGIKTAIAALRQQKEDLRLAQEELARQEAAYDSSKPVYFNEALQGIQVAEARVKQITDAIDSINQQLTSQLNRDYETRRKDVLDEVVKAVVAAGTGPEDRPETVRAAVLGSTQAIAATMAAIDAEIKRFQEASLNGEDATIDGESLIAFLKKRLVGDGTFDEARFQKIAEDETARRFSVVYSSAIKGYEEAQRKADRELTKALISKAVAEGDKNAEIALAEINRVETLSVGLLDYSQQMAKGLENRLSSAGIPEGAKDILSGKFLSDMLSGSKEEQDAALASLEDIETFKRVITEKLSDLYDFQYFQRVLAEGNVAVPGLDQQAIYGPIERIADAIKGGGNIRATVDASMRELITYFTVNGEIARQILVARGVAVDTLNKAETAQLAADAIFSLNGGDMLKLADANIRKQVLAVLTGTGGWINRLKLGIQFLRENAKDLIRLANLSSGGEAETIVSENQSFIETLLKQAQTQAATTQAAMEAAITKTDKRGSKGKTPEQLMTDLEKFLAERNALVIQANLDLAAFGKDFDLSNYIQLRRDQVESDYTLKIAEAKAAYADMFKEIKAGTPEYARLSEMRDRELDQLGKLRDANIEYANSAEFAARASAEAAEAILAKYIEMNTYTGDFLNGVLTGFVKNSQELMTEFEVGIETAGQLINGVTQFATKSFNSYFTEVATGQKTLEEVLRQGLADMLLSWANYFADLAIKYAIDWALKQALGIVTGGASNFTTASTAFATGGGYIPGLTGPSLSLAKGGITTGTEYFAYSGTKNVGRRGEAGDEATLPLARDSKGNLGVVAMVPDKNENNGRTLTMNSTTELHLPPNGGPSPETDFALMRRVEERQREAALQVIAEEQRPGGLLYGRQ